MEVNPLPCNIVILGAKGDLSKRKLLPALYNLARRELLHEKTRLVMCVREAFDFAEYLGELLPASRHLHDFVSRFSCVAGDFTTPSFISELSRVTAESGLERTIFYFATASDAYLPVIEQLYNASLLSLPSSSVVLEKPFGFDYADAEKLEISLQRYLSEEQIYRIDHYLGKETVQNILMFRFANILFENVWNRNFVEKVVIDAFETVGVERRGKYFDRAGLLRDMFQNHMLEMLSLAAMECPVSFDAESIRDEKLKLLKSVRPFDPATLCPSIRRAQYSTYRSEENVAPDSITETAVSAVFHIDNWRWSGVPFILRSGKAFTVKKTDISIYFKPVPLSIFPGVDVSGITPNCLILSVQPKEGLTLRIQAKHPGPKLCMGPLDMRFYYASLLEKGEDMPDAYERLLLDCMLEDRTLFIRKDTILRSWEILAPILEHWREKCPLGVYAPGTNPFDV